MEVFHGKRLAFILLAHFAFALMYIQRLNLSVALTAMVKSPRQHINNNNNNNNNKNSNNNSNITLRRTGKNSFDWDEAHQGMLLSAFYYGYVPLNLPAGVLVDRYGGKLVCGLGILISSFFSLLTPVASFTSYTLAMVVRVGMGFAQGVVYPGLFLLLRKWSPEGGKNRMVALALVGTETGAVLAFFLGGVLSDSEFLGGWPSGFYIFGAAGIIWFIAWIAFVTETPEYQVVLDDDEALYDTANNKEDRETIDRTHNDKEDKAMTSLPLATYEDEDITGDEDIVEDAIPWLRVLTSLPLCATVVAIFCQDWVWFFIITDLPLYYKQVLNISVFEGGVYSTLPILLAALTKTASGFLSDYLQKSWCSVKATRRFTSSLGFFPTALLLIAISYTKEGETVQAVAFMTLCAGFVRLSHVTFIASIFDLSPSYTGVLIGIANAIGVSAGIGAPLVTGFFTNHDPSWKKWQIVFLINAGFCVLGGLFYFIFVSAQVQEWDPECENENKGIKKSIEE